MSRFRQKKGDVQKTLSGYARTAKLVDNDPRRFPSTVLQEWKINAEGGAAIRVGRTVALSGCAGTDLSGESIGSSGGMSDNRIYWQYG